MQSRLREAILAVVPRDGTRISNQSLLRQVIERGRGETEPFEEEAVHAVRDQLIAEGVLRRGRGRGGSVSRVNGEDRPVRQQNGGEGTGADTLPADGDGLYGTYRHGDCATLRPDVGVQDQFAYSRKPKQYRYDSSLAPELRWDENAEREFAEWLITLIADAAERGEDEVFRKAQRWQGTGERFESVKQCAARIRSLTRPFLDWAGKAERQQIEVPTVPLFVHERHSTRAILEC